MQLPSLPYERVALLTVGKLFSFDLGSFRLLMPLFFYRRSASHGSLPEVLEQGFEVEQKFMTRNL
jgi:hypothetical protein